MSPCPAPATPWNVRVGTTARDCGARSWPSAATKELASEAMAEAFAQALGRGAAVAPPDRWIWRTAFRIAAGELKERRRVAAFEGQRASVDMPLRLVACSRP